MTDREQRDQNLRTFAEGLGLQLDDVFLLERALTHASAAGDVSEPLPNYETLEFLGDAVLGMAVAEWLYVHVPDRTPGEYSQMRAGVVNRRALAGVADSLGLAPLIRLGKSEECGGGRRRNALLADCIEAVIAAVYLDQGWEAARSFIFRVFDKPLKEAGTRKPVWDYKSRLQMRCQAEWGVVPDFTVINESGPDHAKEFEIEVSIQGRPAGRGTGRSKRSAEQAAARAALEELNET